METIADTDAGSTAAQDFPRIPLDMNAIARAAMAPKLRRWRVEFDCNGQPWEWTGTAVTAGAADFLARAELSERYSGYFDSVDARTVVCVEVSA